MTKTYNNIEKFSEDFYQIPFEFAEELIKSEDFSLCHVPLSKRDYPEYESVDIFTVLVDNRIATQFYRKYNDGIMFLEQLKD